MNSSNQWLNVLLSAVALHLSHVAHAESITWVGGPSGIWSTPENWSAGAVPGVYDEAIVATESVVSFDIGSTQTVGGVSLKAPSVDSGAVLQLSAGSILETVNIGLGGADGTRGHLVIGSMVGDPADSAGYLNANLVQVGVGNFGFGTVSFNHNNANYVFSPGVLGNGFGTQINQLGTGKTVLSGELRDIGYFMITDGTLELTGNVSSVGSGRSSGIWGNGGTLRVSSGAQVVLDMSNKVSYFQSNNPESSFVVDGSGTLFAGNLGGTASLSVGVELQVTDGATFSTQGGGLSADKVYVSGGDLEHSGRLNLKSALVIGGSLKATQMVQQGNETVAMHEGSVLEAESYQTIDGTLQIKNGATVNVTDMDLGDGGMGQFLMDGGKLTVRSLEMGQGINGSISALISGGNITTASEGYARVGTGTLRLEGGTLSSYYGYVGSIYGNSTVTVKGTTLGTTWNTVSGITIGDSGQGTLEIQGGNVTASGVTGSHLIGWGYAGNGTVIVEQNGSLSSNYSITVGSLGRGELDIRSGTVMTQIVELAGGASGTGLLRLEGSSVLVTKQIWEGSGQGKIFVDGGKIEAAGYEENFLANFEAGDVELSLRGLQIDTKGYEIGISSPISGDGGIAKLGSGKLRLSGDNSYAGGTIINAGTLIAGHNNALGTGAITVSGGKLEVDAGVTLSNAVNLAGGEYARLIPSGGNLAGFVNVTASPGITGNATAQTLAGVVSQQATVEVSVYVPEGSSTPVFHLSGLPQVGPYPGQTDIFVLQLSFTDAGPGTFLAWLNWNNEWVNAIEGNFGNNPSFESNPFNYSFETFQSQFPALTLEQSLGAWGSYSDGGQTHVWAVLNHNSEFTAIPEPSTYALVMLGLGALGWARLRTMRRG